MHNFSQREKNLLKILGIIVAATLIYSFIIEPVFILRGQRTTSSKTKQEDLEALEKIYTRYSEIQSLKNRINLSINNNTSVSSVIYEGATSLNIPKSNFNIKEYPGKTESRIQKIRTEMKIEGMSIKPILNLVDRIENSSMYIKVKKINLNQTATNKSKYDAIIEFENFIKRN